MTVKSYGPRKPAGGKIDKEEVKRVVAEARQAQTEHEQSYR